MIPEFDPYLAEPLQPVLAFHRRVERKLADLAALPSRIEGWGMNAEAMGGAASILRAFGTSAAFHHSVEEREILPWLQRRIADPTALGAFRALRMHLEGDHREIERTWRRLARPLAAIAEGVRRPLDREAIGYFRALWSAHVSMEESSLHEVLLRQAAFFPGRRAAVTQPSRR